MGMKISEVKQFNSCAEISNAKPASGFRDEFTRVLAEESDKIGEATGEIQSGTGAAALPSLVDLTFVPVKNDFSDLYRQAESSIEGTICRLEKLQSALLDPKGSLEGIATAIGNLSTGGEELQHCAASLPSNHPLRQLADELAVLGQVESAKFRRGDYS
jgi:hypothetical protein